MGNRETATPGLFTRKALAEAFDVHSQTVTKWEADGLPIEVRGTAGRPSLYKLSACIAWRIERELKARGLTDKEALSPLAQRALLDAKRTEDLDLRIRVRKGELIEVEEASRDLANVAVATKARMRRIPDASVTRVIATAKGDPKTAPAVRKLMLADIDDALRELAARGEPAEGAA